MIQTYLEKIKNAIYGKDVRQAIHDAIHQCYEDGKAGELDLIAREQVAQLSNPNLLINSDFRRPVNQRGKTNYESSITTWSSIYTVDRWFIQHGNTVTVNPNSLTLTNVSTEGTGTFVQRFENALPVGDYTVSVNVLEIAGTGYVGLSYQNGEDDVLKLEEGLNILTVKNKVPTRVQVTCTIGCSVELAYIKFEHGTIATPFVPRLYGEELALCQRYYMQLPYNHVAYAGSDGNLYLCFDTRVLNMREKPSFIGANKITLVFEGGIYEYTIASVNTDNLIDKGYVKVDYTYSNKVGYAHKSMVAYFNIKSYLDAEIY